jgi:hypothetical protein
MVGMVGGLAARDLGRFFFFLNVYWEGKVTLYMYPTSLYREEGVFFKLGRFHLVGD